MHVYLVLAAYISVLIVSAWKRTRAVAKVAGVALVLTLLFQAGVFVRHGQGVGTTGWWAMREGRDREFLAGNGVRVKVSALERRYYDRIYRTVRASSLPSDYIVCVPYCAGFAFMSERRMLFAQHYVDDSTPIVYPNWIDNAIQKTADTRPPIIIVLDWAPNGTNVSRFDVWAARYMDFVATELPVHCTFAVRDNLALGRAEACTNAKQSRRDYAVRTNKHAGRNGIQRSTGRPFGALDAVVDGG